MEFLNDLRDPHEQGRQLILATAADEQLARRIADYLRFFDRILASDGITDLTGVHKKNRLVAEFGEKGFDYAGNDGNDLAVWASARRAIVVGSSQRIFNAAGRTATVAKIYESHNFNLALYLRTCRLIAI